MNRTGRDLRELSPLYMNELCIVLSAAEATSGLAEGLVYTVGGFLKKTPGRPDYCSYMFKLAVSCTVTVLLLSFYLFSLRIISFVGKVPA